MATQREIKFRALRRGYKWHHGLLVFNGSKVADYAQIMSEDGSISVPLERETVGQYTGLKDKEGREIYEGDIIHLDNVREEILGNVEMIDGSWRVYDKGRGRNWVVKAMDQWYTIAVIGNIYENPEILEA